MHIEDQSQIMGPTHDFWNFSISSTALHAVITALLIRLGDCSKIPETTYVTNIDTLKAVIYIYGNSNLNNSYERIEWIWWHHHNEKLFLTPPYEKLF